MRHVMTVALIALCAACASKNGGSTTAPTGTNRPPAIASISVSPSGMGIDSATVFTFAAQGASDPDGDTLTYSWSSTDGASITSTNQAASHVYMRSGVFDMRVTVTDPKGLSSSAATTVRVGNLTGTWDVTCENHPPVVLTLYPAFPSLLVVTLIQSGHDLVGTMSAAGLSRNLQPGSGVSDPKRAIFGVETVNNAWAPRDGDFYFHLNADDTLNVMTGAPAGNYCGASTARRR